MSGPGPRPWNDREDSGSWVERMLDEVNRAREQAATNPDFEWDTWLGEHTRGGDDDGGSFPF